VCGIAGVIDTSAVVDAGLIHRMCAAMQHRGPDGRGVHLEPGVGLGVQRLAIIDRDHGEQPITNETGDVVVVFNGEIYNHRELRRELIRRGHRFRSAVDTEVLAHLYEDHGSGLVQRLQGMFAFALWDSRRRRLLCARDRFGKKPLFWTRRGGRFMFASELYALLEDETIQREVEPQAIDAYLALQYVPPSVCAVRGVHKLPPATTLVLDEGGSERIDRYWALRYGCKRTGASRPELEAELRELLDDATRLRMQGDVPVGALLSGGLDSSAVVSAMAATGVTVKTFSVGFDDAAHDESRFARLVAERMRTDHHELRLHPQVAATMPKLARHFGEPFGDSSALAVFQICELVSREVTVLLGGDGGDEAFAGYERYVPPARAQLAARVPRSMGTALERILRPLGDGESTRSVRTRLCRLAKFISLDDGDRYVNSVLVFDARARNALLAPGFLEPGAVGAAERMLIGAWAELDGAHDIDRMMGVDVASYLPGDLLVKLDVAAMAHSVETRSPFLDHRLMEFAAALPLGLKLDRSGSKALLRSALRGVLPEEVLTRRKAGFAVPLGSWLRRELRGLPAELMLDPAAATGEYLDPQSIRLLIGEHERGVADHSMRLWTLMMLEMWHREVLTRATPRRGVGESPEQTTKR
jgi:asparagine synthase (glutamine-hydrolysing)